MTDVEDLSNGTSISTCHVKRQPTEKRAISSRRIFDDNKPTTKLFHNYILNSINIIQKQVKDTYTV